MSDYTGPGVASICIICERTIDLHHAMHPYKEGYAHIGCHAFHRYQQLVDVGWELLQALDSDEDEVDWDATRELLRDALMEIERR